MSSSLGRKFQETNFEEIPVIHPVLRQADVMSFSTAREQQATKALDIGELEPIFGDTLS